MAPEVINFKKNGEFCPFMADIWSLGVSIYCFAYFKVPFQGKNLEELFENIAKQEIVYPKTYPRGFV